MADPFATTISLLALTVSGVTAWLTLFRRGTIKMTQPTIVYLGPDAPPGSPKVYVRTLLFSTSKRGRVVESMHVVIVRNETRQNFNIWVHGEEKLVRGSGLFVGETGVSANHHFLAPKDGSSFEFLEGEYTLKMRAKLLGDDQSISLWTQKLTISKEHAAELRQPEAGLYFDWGPDSDRYISHVDKRPPIPKPGDLLRTIGFDRV